MKTKKSKLKEFHDYLFYGTGKNIFGMEIPLGLPIIIFLFLPLLLGIHYTISNIFYDGMSVKEYSLKILRTKDLYYDNCSNIKFLYFNHSEKLIDEIYTDKFEESKNYERLLELSEEIKMKEFSNEH